MAVNERLVQTRILDAIHRVRLAIGAARKLYDFATADVSSTRVIVHRGRCLDDVLATFPSHNHRATRKINRQPEI
jgi:hypothetical protein